MDNHEQLPIDALAVEIHWIEPPRNKRSLWCLLSQAFAELLMYQLRHAKPRPALAAGIGLVEPAEIEGIPACACQSMAVSLYQAGLKHLVDKTFVDGVVVTEGPDFIKRGDT